MLWTKRQMWKDGEWVRAQYEEKDLLPFEVQLLDKVSEVGNSTEERPEVDFGQRINFNFLSSCDTGVAQLILDEGALAKAGARAQRRYMVLRTPGPSAARHFHASRSNQIECLAGIALSDDDIAKCEATPSHSFGKMRALGCGQSPERCQTAEKRANDRRFVCPGFRIVDAFDHGQPANVDAADAPGTPTEQFRNPLGPVAS